MKKYKFLITLSLVVVLAMICFFALPTEAKAATDGDYTYTVENGEATITEYTGAGGDITIPSSLGGYPVTIIGRYAFSNNGNNLPSIITIPDTVTTIGDYAFEYCYGLTSVTIPDSVTTIGYFAFADCHDLTSVTIPDSVTTIGSYAFSCCYSLKSVVLGNGLKTIEGRMFFYSYSLKSITIPDSVTTIDDNAFLYCDSLRDVWYTGSVAQRDNILFGSMNHKLENSKWHYNICLPNNHQYTGDNGQCNNCEWVKCDNGYHVFSGNCDASCNSCSYTRTVPEHVYDNACDAVCNICDNIRTVPNHVYDNACDAVCNICDNIRTVPEHVYDNTCDTDCNICGNIRTITHTYNNNCDTSCNICGNIRTITHTYSNSADLICNVCKESLAPGQPTLEKALDTSVTMVRVSGFEYSMDGVSWQTSNVFTGLEPATQYHFYQRVAETKDSHVSPASPALEVTTLGRTGTVTYYANGGENAPVVQYKVAGEPLTITAEKPTCENRIFMGWSTKPYGAVEYRPGQTYLEDASLTLFAVWGSSCQECGGDGTVQKTCSTCNGSGYYYKYYSTCCGAGCTLVQGAYGVSYYRCQQCGDMCTTTSERQSCNRYYSATCPECVGRGTVKTPHLVTTSPTLQDRTSWSITLMPQPDMEYSIDGVSWQTSNVFTGLQPGTEYAFYQRYVENSNHAPAQELCPALRVSTRASKPAPGAPVVSSYSDCQAVLVPITGGEYSMDGVTWQTSNVFTGLLPVTTYTFYQRYAAEGDLYCSPMSVGTSITTDMRTPQTRPVIPEVETVTANSVTLKTVEGCEYSMDGKVWQKSPVFTGLSWAKEYTFYQRYAQTNDCYASGISPALQVKTDKGTESAPSAPSLNKADYNCVELVDYSPGTYEYSRDLVNWQTSPVFEGLEPNTNYMFYRRYVETDTYYTSEPSPYLRVKTLVQAEWIAITGIPSKLSYKFGEELELTGLVVMAYFVDGTSVEVTDYAVSGYTAAPGTQTIMVTYHGRTATFQVEVEAVSGWISEGGKWYFYESNVKHTGWLNTNNVWYYMDAAGAMQTGWLQVGGAWYYLDSAGIMQTGWQKIGGTWYFFNNSGAMATGWLYQGGVWYYFGTSGAMATGWVQSGGVWYYFHSSGAMATGWLQSGGVWYYFKSSGAMTTGWLQSGGVWYYFKPSGAMATGWVYQGGVWYYFKSSGAMATGSMAIGGKTYRFNSSGACLNP